MLFIGRAFPCLHSIDTFSIVSQPNFGVEIKPFASILFFFLLMFRYYDGLRGKWTISAEILAVLHRGGKALSPWNQMQAISITYQLGITDQTASAHKNCILYTISFSYVWHNKHLLSLTLSSIVNEDVCSTAILPFKRLREKKKKVWKKCFSSIVSFGQ